MRQFVVVAHELEPDADVSLVDLPGTGRLDLLCRCVGAAIFLSHGIRESVRVHLVIDDAYTVRFDADSLRHLHPDERNIAARIRDALDARAEAIGHQPAAVSPGVAIVRMGLSETIEQLAQDGSIIQLHEDGTGLAAEAPPTDPVFVLSDHRDFTAEERETITAAADRRIRVGPKTLHADHAITIAHNWLDTDGYASE